MEPFKLENQPKISTGFSYPVNYFEDFSSQFLSQLPQNKTKVRTLFNYKTIGIVAAAVVIISLFIPVYSSLNSTTIVIDSETLENHLTYQTDISAYELIGELESENIAKIQSKLPVKTEILEEILTSNPDLENLISE